MKKQFSVNNKVSGQGHRPKMILRLKQYMSQRMIIIAASVFLVITTIGLVIYFQVSKVSKVKALAAAANLSQARNGTDASPTNPVNWVNGNLNSSNTHYIEGMSIPYQCIMTGLTIGTQVTLTMGYDIRNSSKHAIDYLTYYNRLTPHGFSQHSTVETINPLTGSGLSSAPSTTYPIPTPSSSGSTVAGQPTTSFNALSSSERLMTLYNGTIDTIYYSSQGSLTATSSETQIVIKFTPSATTAVLAWGGHVASRNDWGYVSGSPLSAGGISGSPFHMRMKSWSMGSIGNQDRSLSGDAVSAPPSPLPIELIYFKAQSEKLTVNLIWATASEINNDFFTVERSKDGQAFEEVLIKSGAGNSTRTLYYSAVDDNPLKGISYYRLKQTDYDGKFSYSPVKSVKLGPNNDVNTQIKIESIAQNPFADKFILNFNVVSKGNVEMLLLNTSGQIVYRETILADKGFNSYFFTDKVGLRSGIYFVKLLYNGDESSQKIIKE